MPTLTVLPSGKTAQVEAGITLLAAVNAAGEPLRTKCTDENCSGECHVFVPQGKKSLSKATREENAKLDTIVGVGSKSRLACQTRVGTEDITVELLGFAS
ncbi:MAG TPA: 2Fe-2S iron-sulfur cluster binding domain-containing protein [Polyangiaceae bacterium]|nr:2Fe-2S iron-sulfur cluster binding domain-containing protein [Polyangiaceae bacterium]